MSSVVGCCAVTWGTCFWGVKGGFGDKGGDVVGDGGAKVVAESGGVFEGDEGELGFPLSGDGDVDGVGKGFLKPRDEVASFWSGEELGLGFWSQGEVSGVFKAFEDGGAGSGGAEAGDFAEDFSQFGIIFEELTCAFHVGQECAFGIARRGFGGAGEGGYFLDGAYFSVFDRWEVLGFLLGVFRGISHGEPFGGVEWYG